MPSPDEEPKPLNKAQGKGDISAHLGHRAVLAGAFVGGCVLIVLLLPVLAFLQMCEWLGQRNDGGRRQERRSALRGGSPGQGLRHPPPRAMNGNRGRSRGTLVYRGPEPLFCHDDISQPRG